jgi:hypothetical protein
MNKRDICKLKAGTFVELCWDDAPNNVGMLLDKPRMEKGDISLHIMYSPDEPISELLGNINYHAIHTQVVRTRGHITFPDLN